jgi:hypothetical protein
MMPTEYRAAVCAGLIVGALAAWPTGTLGTCAIKCDLAAMYTTKQFDSDTQGKFYNVLNSSGQPSTCAELWHLNHRAWPSTAGAQVTKRAAPFLTDENCAVECHAQPPIRGWALNCSDLWLNLQNLSCWSGCQGAPY